jgi:hypothetical protein
MKTIIPALAALVLLASCSAPKYSYNFDYYDYNSGKKNAEQVLVSESDALPVLDEPAESPLILDEQALVADASSPAPTVMHQAKPKEQRTYAELSKAEKKAFRKELKSELKKYIKAKKAGDDGSIANNTKAMDHDLKLAIIFGAVALTLSFFGGVNSVFWVLSVISLVIAVVFFVKWIARQ